MKNKFARAGMVFGLLGILGACTSVDVDQRLTALEERVNQALRDSASAKIDATTALMIADEK